MISLNLLSPEKKKEISKQMIFVSLQYLVSWILISVCAAGTILLATKLFMQNAFSQAVRVGALVTQEYGALNQRVYLVNQKIDFFSNIQRQFVVWSPKLAAFTEIIPANIQINSINLNYTTKDIQISGYAAKRDDLLLLKQNLERSALINTINMPIENLLEANDINFNIKGKIAI